MDRLLVVYDGPRAPWDNMALDLALLESIEEMGPVLRLYEWALPTISLGRRQVLEESVRMSLVEELGLSVVRRPTGGRALYHSPMGEVTYSIVLPASHPLYRLGVVESAARIAMGVAEALRRLGVDARVGGFDGYPAAGANCMLSPGASDVVVSGRKLSGSAQYRSGRGLLQHGAVIVRKDLEGWRAIRGPDARLVAELSTSVEEHLGRRVEREEISRFLADAMGDVVGLKVEWGWFEPWLFEVADRLVDRVLVK